MFFSASFGGYDLLLCLGNQGHSFEDKRTKAILGFPPESKLLLGPGPYGIQVVLVGHARVAFSFCYPRQLWLIARKKPIAGWAVDIVSGSGIP